jgi:hypothetical protein
MSDNRRFLLKTIFSLFPQVAYKRLAKKNITITHGDAHLGNFFFPKVSSNQKSKAILFDWTFWSVGVGCQDLAFMIGLWFFPDYRHVVEKDLVKRYHSHLLKCGIKNYSWDECWYDYRLFALFNIYRIIYWWRLGMPAPQLWYKLEISLQTIEDLCCMDLLKSKN